MYHVKRLIGRHFHENKLQKRVLEGAKFRRDLVCNSPKSASSIVVNNWMVGTNAKASSEMSWFDLNKGGRFSSAVVDSVLTASMKMTPRWRVDRRRDVTLENYPRPFCLDLGVGNWHR